MYEIFEQLLNERGVTAYRVSKETGITTATLTSWKQGKYTPKLEKLQKIADYFGVSIDYLITGNKTRQELYTCPDCGLCYVPTYANDVMEHLKVHDAYKKAVEKFGNLYTNSAINEEIKAKNRNIRDDENSSLEMRYDAELEVLKCLFSRSVKASRYDADHVSYEKYVAMMLANPTYGSRLDSELFEMLKEKFGTLPGINSGTYYQIPASTKGISKNDERDITKDLNSLIEKLSSKEYGPAAYDGEELSEDSVSLFKDELELALRRLKLINKEKYNPNKNKK